VLTWSLMTAVVARAIAIRFGVPRQQGIGIAVEELLDRSTGDVWRPR
jgi:hypothetical protein